MEEVWPEIFLSFSASCQYILLLGNPDVSPLLSQAAREKAIPVFTEKAYFSALAPSFPALRERQELEKFLEQADREEREIRYYVSDEECLSWIEEGRYACLQNTERAVKILKDKVLFRQKSASLYPEIFFRALTEVEEDFTLPQGDYVLKPARGFYGKGVRLFSIRGSQEETRAQVSSLLEEARAEIAQCSQCFSSTVLNSEVFLIETCLSGLEVAVDMVWRQERAQREDTSGRVENVRPSERAQREDTSGRAQREDTSGRVEILGLYLHPQLGPEVILYYSSPEIMSLLLEKARTTFAALAQLDQSAFTDLPVHAEFKLIDTPEVELLGLNWSVDKKWSEKRLLPLEINPGRFGSYGLVDMTYYNYRVNPYSWLFSGQNPSPNILFPAITTFLVALRQGPGHPQIKKLQAHLPGQNQASLEIASQELPFFALLQSSHTPDSFQAFLQVLRSIRWSKFISPRLQIFPSSVVWTYQIEAFHLQQLFTGQIKALIIPDYYPEAGMKRLLDYIEKKETVDYTHEIYNGDSPRLESYGVQRIGPALNNYYSSLARADHQFFSRYQEEAEIISQEIRATCQPLLTPAEKFLKDLQKAWPSGAEIATFPCGLQSWSGILRVMNPGDKNARKLAEELHVDCLPDYILPLKAQISLNVYLEVPENSGALLLSRERKIYSCSEIKELGQASFQASLPEWGETFPVHPEKGWAVLINTGSPHAVEVPLGRRISLQTFVGLPEDEESPLQVWN